MLEARFKEASTLKKLLESIREIIQDANFDASATGISMQAMDNSHVSLVCVLLNAGAFETYRCDREIQLGMSLKNVNAIVKCASNDDACTLKCKDGNDSMEFLFEEKKNDTIKHFDMKLMDIDSETLGVPNTDYQVTVVMPSSQFQRICKDLATFGDSVTIKANKDACEFRVAGDMGSGSIICKKTVESSDVTEANKITIECNDPVELSFALRYLNMFARASSISDMVKISISPDVPICIEYVVPAADADSEDNGGYIRYYLAPKIDEEATAAPQGAQAHQLLEARPAGLALWARCPPSRTPAVRRAPKRIDCSGAVRRASLFGPDVLRRARPQSAGRPSASIARGPSGGPRSLGQMSSVARARSPQGAQAHQLLEARPAGLALWARCPPSRAPAVRRAPKRINCSRPVRRTSLFGPDVLRRARGARSPQGAQAHQLLEARPAGLALWARWPP
eukprot:tig00020553_g10631.t1